MVLKGGILLALQYDSSRFTRDIDFSTDRTTREVDLEDFIATFEAALVEAVSELGYDVDCIVQGWQKQPPRADATFPTIRIRVGYAKRGDERLHRRLMRKEAQHVVKIDFSLNEPLGEPELLEIEEGKSIRTYSFHDLIAEKIRAVLQQEVRNRQRRQDVYDLNLLLKNNSTRISDEINSKVYHSLKIKSAARELDVDKKSMRNPEIIRRSRQEYSKLEAEIEGELPDFDETYEFVRSYYECLPWE